MAFVVVAVAAAVVAPIITGSGLQRAQASGTTVTGTVSGDNAYDPSAGQPNPGAQNPLPPSVTVDQTTDLTSQMVHVTWKNFTPSSKKGANSFYDVALLECRGTNPGKAVVNGATLWNPNFGDDCFTAFPNTPNDVSVGNRVTALTGANGTGEAYFHIETAVENSFLSCDPTHPCSLLVVPNWGGVQPSGKAPGDPGVNCKDHTKDTTGLGAGFYAADAALSLACSWGDRFVFPLQFAPTPAQCPSAAPAFAAQGAPMLTRTVSLFQAGWCNDANKLSFDFDSGTNEYLARQSFLAGGSGALTSAADLAVVNRPPDPSAAAARKFTYAPVVTSGIAIAFHVDDPQTGQFLTDLTLNARLVAKLLTQSYALFPWDCHAASDTSTQGPDCDPAIKGNPRSVFVDPEFRALNPQYTDADFPLVAGGGLMDFGGFLPLVVSGNSDLVYELTRWVASDPDAAAFLAGKPDPWGMRVNTYYRGISYPLDQFQVLDPGYTAPPDIHGAPGKSTMQNSWNPISGLNLVANSLVIDRPSAVQYSLISCPPNTSPPDKSCTWPRMDPEAPGTRAVFAVVGLNDAAADEFPTAKLVNAGGRAVAPDTGGLSAAVSDMKTNPDKITQFADFANPDPKQYPLTMVDYALVPTCGLSDGKAAAIGSFLDHVATSQLYGVTPGSLAPGNEALTGAQVAQVRSAQQAVSTQSCTSAPPDTTISGGPPRSNVGSTGNGGSPVSGHNGQASVPSGGAPLTTASGTPNVGATPSASLTQAAFGIKHGDADGPLGAWLPVLLGLGALLVAGGPATYLLSTTGAGAALLSWLRRITTKSIPSAPPVTVADAAVQQPETGQ
ncbi:hypothetical protein Raf01_80070 [Rugosimonospora africana]|uniref:PBP domain-containing protein n=1 Tax=Rugosimonospora africana TaxID=556532 RepID=A0A8J3R1U6_9ACTN|nr:hypothetical protein Raf01_80070 [Rugosimonospora africana]